MPLLTINHRRNLQVRLLRAVQERLHWYYRRWECILVQDKSVLGRISLCWVFRWHCSVSYGVLQGQNPNQRRGYFPHHPEGRCSQDLRCRRIERLLQVLGTIVGSSNSLHHDEVRLLWANSRGSLCLRCSQTQRSMLQSWTTCRDIRCWLHCWR